MVKSVVMFQAEDGTLFDTEEAAKMHDSKIRLYHAVYAKLESDGFVPTASPIGQGRTEISEWVSDNIHDLYLVAIGAPREFVKEKKP